MDTSIFSSSAIKSARSSTTNEHEHQLSSRQSSESLKDLQSENQLIDQVHLVRRFSDEQLFERFQSIDSNKEQYSQSPTPMSAPVMKLTDSMLNMDTLHTPSTTTTTTSTPICAHFEQFQEHDKYTPPTIKTTEFLPTLKNPPLAPKRQNTRIM